MSRTGLSAAEVCGMRGEAQKDFRLLALNVLFTAILLGAQICAVLYFVPAIAGKSKQSSVTAILIAALLPIATLVMLSSVERLFPPAGPRKSLRSWFLHLQINIFWAITASFTFSVAALLSAALARHFGFNVGLIDLRFAEGKGVLALIAAVWFAAIAEDFFFYWYHRAAHKFATLWQMHKLHHMDPALDVLTVNRDNWVDAFVAAVLIGIPTGIFLKLDDLDPVKLGLLSGTVVAVWTALLTLGHMNVRLQVGKASVLYCSPQVHRIHHSCLPQHFDRNFAFVLPLWDVIFGTYYPPARDEFPPTGVPGEREIGSFWEAQAFTLREWHKMYVAWRSRLLKASA